MKFLGLLVLIFSAVSQVNANTNTNSWELPRVEVSPSDPYKIDKYKVQDPVASTSTYTVPSQPVMGATMQPANTNTYKTKSIFDGYTSAPRYMAIHLGTYFNDEAHEWGDFGYENPGKLNAGVSYRLGEWVNSCLLYTSPSPRDATLSRMPSSA